MITVIYSSQARMAESAAKGLIKASLPEKNEFNFVKLDMATNSMKELGEELNFLPIGEEKKLVLATNFFQLAKTRIKQKAKKDDDDSDLIYFLKNPDPYIDLIILVISDEIDTSSSNKYYSALKSSNSNIKQVAPLSPQEWLSKIENTFTKKGIQIDRAAVRELNNRIQGDYAKFLSETQKLIAYSGGSMITKKDVESLVSRPLEDDSFSLSNALLRGNIERAMSIYKDFKVGGVEPLLLARGLANQFRFLNQVSYLDKNGYSANQIAAMLNAKPYRVEVALSNLSKMKDDTCKNALENLYQFEYCVLSGKIDADIGFSLFLSTFEL